MSNWVNSSLDDALGLAPGEPRIARRIPVAADERARIASIDASLEALAERDRGWRAWRGDKVSRGER